MLKHSTQKLKFVGGEAQQVYKHIIKHTPVGFLRERRRKKNTIPLNTMQNRAYTEDH